MHNNYSAVFKTDAALWDWFLKLANEPSDSDIETRIPLEHGLLLCSCGSSLNESLLHTDNLPDAFHPAWKWVLKSAFHYTRPYNHNRHSVLLRAQQQHFSHCFCEHICVLPAKHLCSGRNQFITHIVIVTNRITEISNLDPSSTHP